MKTRVYKYGSKFYPQYKGLLFWHYIYAYDYCVFFDTAEEAIKYLTKTGWHRWEEVVWESK